MDDRRKHNKGFTTVRNLRFFVGCALIGSVMAGALLAWLPSPIDVRFIGATVGAALGLASSHLA